MKKIFYLLVIFINFIGCTNAQDNKRMTNINSIFDKMELQGVDTKKPLLFGYFFYDKSKSKLENLKNGTQRLGIAAGREFIAVSAPNC